MNINQAVNVTITRQTAAAAGTEFGIPLIFAPHAYWPELVKSFTSLDDVTDAGVPTDDLIYKAAAAMMSQTPRPPVFKVGRWMTNTIRFRVDDADVEDDTDYTATICGTEVTIDSGAYATGETIMQAFVDAIGNLSGVNAVAVLDGTGEFMNVEVSADDADEPFYLTIESPLRYHYTMFSGRVDFSGFSTLAGWTAAIGSDFDEFRAVVGLTHEPDDPADPLTSFDACRDVDDGFYPIVGTVAGTGESGVTDLLAAQGWDDDISEPDFEASLDFIQTVETMRKIVISAFARAKDATPFGPTDMPSADRTGCHATTNSLAFSDAAWVGKMAPKQPGSATWAYKELNGIEDDGWTNSQILAYIAARLNVYTTTASLPHTWNGAVLSGEWIDIMVGVDYLTDLLETKLFIAMAQNDKIPFTNAGIAVVESILREVYQLGVEAGILTTDTAPEYTIPKSTEVSAANKAARTLPGVKFTWYLAGAIHKVTINGVVAY